jgi:2,4-diaminopentanoate dehydrogenase
VEVACGTLPAGTVVGQIMSWSAYRDGEPVLVAEEYWAATRDIPGWDVELAGQFLVRVIVEGAPSVRVDLTIGNDAVGELEGTSGGQLAVAMTAVRAIPDVRRAPPGVVVAPVFGAYSWPDR